MKIQVVTDEIKDPSLLNGLSCGEDWSSSNLRRDSTSELRAPWNERCGASFSLQEQSL